MARLIVILALMVSGCGLNNHPVQTLPRDYRISEFWLARGCRPRGESVVIDGEKLVTLRCSDGMRMITYIGGVERAFVSWEDIK